MNRLHVCWARWTSLVVLVSAMGCGAVKERKVVTAPTGYARAQTATPRELADLINSRYSGVDSVTVPRFEVEFTGGSIEEGYLEKYRKAKGYLIAQRPDSIFVNILNPLTNSSVLVMSSQNERFRIWIPSKNQFVMGRTDYEAEDENPVYNVRPSHILGGILIEPIPLHDPALRYYVEEEDDGEFRYYVLGVFEFKVESPLVELRRKLWIERSSMQLRRQQYYRNAELLSVILYGGAVKIQEKWVNTQVEIRRPRERYVIDFQLDSDNIGLNREIKTDAFEISQPAGAEVILVGYDDTE